MENRHKIVLDFKRRTITSVKFVQNDIDTSIFEFTICDNGVPVSIIDQDITMTFLKPDNTSVIQGIGSGVAILDAEYGKFECILHSQTLAAVGTVNAEASFSQNGDRLSTAQFKFNVTASLYNGDNPVSQNVIPLIDAKIEEMDEALDGLDAWKSETIESLDTLYAPITKGVTNGDTHDHSGGDGAQIDHVNLSGIGTNSHEQIDGHISNTLNPHETTAAQVGALVSIAGIENAGGDINLTGGTGITISTDPETKTVQITATGEAIPAPHASSHAVGGLDEVTPASIGAAVQADFSTHLADNASGWIPAEETWIYASDTTFSVAGDKTNKYQSGNKFRLVANGVPLQGYIIDSTYSAPNTIVTVIGDILTNHSYSDERYSRVENPQGFPDWFLFTPTISYGGGTVDPTSLTITEAMFKIQSHELKFMITASLVKGSGDRSYVNFSSPVRASIIPYHACSVYNTVTNTVSHGLIDPYVITVSLGGAMTLDGTIAVEGFYKI